RGNNHRCAAIAAPAARGEAGAEDLCLEEILRLYNQPINEEQAWAVCYQCCRTSSAAAAGATSSALPGRISGPGDVRIQRDGSVTVENQGCEGKISCKTFVCLKILGSRPGHHLHFK
uniref:KIND domain-containing protein n=1 Tax=Lates calcarifer TaxID=8187 RepID=A0A4W6EV17_LATCA